MVTTITREAEKEVTGASVNVIRPGEPLPGGQPPETPSELSGPYKCPVCNKAFQRPEYLRKHTKTHPHAYACNFPGCTKKFCRLDLLQRHSIRHNNSQSRSMNKAGQTMRAPASSSAPRQSSTQLQPGWRAQQRIRDRKFSKESNLRDMDPLVLARLNSRGISRSRIVSLSGDAHDPPASDVYDPDEIFPQNSLSMKLSDPPPAIPLPPVGFSPSLSEESSNRRHKIQSTQGDAVLIQHLDGRRYLDISQKAGNRPLDQFDDCQSRSESGDPTSDESEDDVIYEIASKRTFTRAEYRAWRMTQYENT
ncbi:hypothetical protein GGR55DRAFT_621800 [Xylaria sp. FL0064]|nr:hypothetical protein GGR55DRAFT_621800 [Xylaria sp. FL0064]